HDLYCLATILWLAGNPKGAMKYLDRGRKIFSKAYRRPHIFLLAIDALISEIEDVSKIRIIDDEEFEKRPSEPSPSFGPFNRKSVENLMLAKAVLEKIRQISK
ncbi:hypothetical protein, partial [Frankia sp. Cj3]|uniref:hypothetical protein n=1 Tax=Frankia sp. Cj3 TaxID=2880976 RepID=UPI001EF4D7B0